MWSNAREQLGWSSVKPSQTLTTKQNYLIGHGVWINPRETREAWAGLGLSDLLKKIHKQIPRCTFKNRTASSASLICPLSETRRPSVLLHHRWVLLCLEYPNRKCTVAAQVWKRLQSLDRYVIKAIDWKIAACVVLLTLNARACVLGKRPHLSLATEWQCCDGEHRFNSLLHEIYTEEKEKEDQTRIERNLKAVERKAASQPAALWR